MNYNPINVNKNMNIDNVNYELLAVIHHHRTQDNKGRHYTCTVQYKEYYHCNDSIVTIQNMEELVKSTTAYLIIYRKKNQ